VAHVEGDDVLPRLGAIQEQGHRLEHLDTGAPLADWEVRPLAANAYLGGWGIAAALGAGADIVVCGRVTDASLTLGPAAWWHGWSPDDWDALAGAVLAGHVIECGAQAVGGNFSGFTGVADMLVPGFPVAEVAADGTSVITKHAGHGGAVTVDTVTAQLLYEVQGPVYLNPDVTLHLDGVRPVQEAPDRVRLAGATGSPPPVTTKVATFGLLGHQQVGTVYVTAPDVDAKTALLQAQIGRDLPDGVDLTFTRIGTAADDPETQWDATVALRVMATAHDPAALERLALGERLGGLYLQSIPGFFHDLAGGLPPPRGPASSTGRPSCDRTCSTTGRCSTTARCCRWRCRRPARSCRSRCTRSRQPTTARRTCAGCPSAPWRTPAAATRAATATSACGSATRPPGRGCSARCRRPRCARCCPR
jgi:hypothetical protein